MAENETPTRPTVGIGEILNTPDDDEPVPSSAPAGLGPSKSPDGPSRYGRHYWCVETADDLIRLHADRIEVTANGALVAWCDNSRIIAGTEPFQVFGWAPGVWRGFFAASVVDGGAVAVEHWDDLDEVDDDSDE